MFTGENWICHSFHSYFLLPGKYNSPIKFQVSLLRAGRSYCVWRIEAHQSSDPVMFVMDASFKRGDDKSPDTGVVPKDSYSKHSINDDLNPIKKYPEPETLSS